MTRSIFYQQLTVLSIRLWGVGVTRYDGGMYQPLQARSSGNRTIAMAFGVAVAMYCAAWLLYARVMTRYPFDEALRYDILTPQIAAFSVLFAVLYTVGFILMQRMAWPQVSRVYVWTCAVGLLIVYCAAFVTPPVRSPDLFWTLAVAKGWVQLGVHPYQASADALGEHAWNVRAPFISGIVYGPLWAYLTGAVAWATESLRVGITLMKALGVVCLFGGLAAIRALLQDLRVPAARRNVLLLVAASNPLLIHAGVVDVNNDIITFFSLSVAVLLCTRKQYAPSIAVLLVGGMVKYVPWLMVPVPLVRMLMERQWPTRREMLLMLGAILLVITSYIPFGAPALMGRHMRGSFAEFARPEMSFPGGWVLNQFGLSALEVRTAGVVLMMLVMAWCLRTRRHEEVWLYPLLTLIAFGGLWVNPWYLLWILPMALLVHGGWAVWLIGVAGMLMPWVIHPLPLSTLLLTTLLVVAVGAARSQRVAAALRVIAHDVS